MAEDKRNWIYISYASKSKSIYEYATHTTQCPEGISCEDIVGKLKEACKLANLHLEIDQENIDGGNITKFEQEIGDARYVIVVLSDKYFLSPHCMYEWDKIHENTDGKEIRYIFFDEEKITKKGIEYKCSRKFDFVPGGKDEKYYSNIIKDFWDNWKTPSNKRTANYVNAYAVNSMYFEASFMTFKMKVGKHDIRKTSDWKTPFKVIKGLKEIIFNNMKKNISFDKNETEQKVSDLKDWDRKKLEEKLKDQLQNVNSMLVVGDNILKVEKILTCEKHDEFSKYVGYRLGDVFNNIILTIATGETHTQEHTLFEWYDKNQKNQNLINEVLEKSITEIDYIQNNIKLNTEDLDNLLECGHFDILIPFGYSNVYYNRLKEIYGRKNCTRATITEGVIKEITDDVYDNHNKISIIRYLTQSCKKETQLKIDVLASKCVEKDFFTLLKKELESGCLTNLPFPKYLKMDEHSTNENVIDCLNKPISEGKRRNYSQILDDKKYIKFGQPKSQTDIHRNLGCIYLDAISNGDNNGKIVFSVPDILEYINNFVAALLNKSNDASIHTAIKKCKYVMMLGTNFPNWMMRNIWEILTRGKNERKKINIDNSITINPKVKTLIECNKGAFYEGGIDSISKCMSKIKQESKELKDHANYHNVLVSYIVKDSSAFMKFKQRLADVELTSKEKGKGKPLHFFEKCKADSNDKFAEKLNSCNLHIIFCASYEIDDEDIQQIELTSTSLKKCLIYTDIAPNHQWFDNIESKYCLSGILNNDELFDKISNLIKQ